MTPTKADEDAAREWLEANWQSDEMDPDPSASFEAAVESLAAFRAEARREADAEIEEIQAQHYKEIVDLDERRKAAVQSEREACARLAEEYGDRAIAKRLRERAK